MPSVYDHIALFVVLLHSHHLGQKVDDRSYLWNNPKNVKRKEIHTLYFGHGPIGVVMCIIFHNFLLYGIITPWEVIKVMYESLM